MSTTTSYGTWVNHGGSYNASPGGDILDAINGGGADWRERLETPNADGATPLELIEADYREAINTALPHGVTLAGSEFIGPWFATDEEHAEEFSGYPADEFGELDIKAIVASVDLMAIIEAHDPDLTD